MIQKFLSLFLVLGVVLFPGSGILSPKIATAASLTGVSDVVSTLTASTVANHTITFTTPSGVQSGETIILTFDNSTNIPSGLNYEDIDLKFGVTEMVLAAAPTGATMGVVRTDALTLTFTNGSTEITAGSVVEIQIGTHATTGSTGVEKIVNGPAGTTVLRISGTFGDVGAASMAIISDSTVAVSAEVLASISFSISDNNIYFGNLRSNGACFAQGTDPGYVTCPTVSEAEAFNMTAGTNATTGYTISVQGATLTSGANTITAIGGTNTASNPGTEQFGLRMTASGGSGSVSAPYSAAGYAYDATDSTASTVATASTPTENTTYSIRYLANIASNTEAGSYTTAHTYIATGNF